MSKYGLKKNAIFLIFISLLMLTSQSVFAQTQEDIELTKLAKEIVKELGNKNFSKISTYVDASEGLQFSRAYDEPFRVVFQKQDLPNFLNTKNQYIWGREPGIGTELKDTTKNYYQEWIYAHDYVNESEISIINSTDDSRVKIIAEYIKQPILVRFRYMGTPDYAYADEESLLLVFHKINGKFHLAGITRIE